MPLHRQLVLLFCLAGLLAVALAWRVAPAVVKAMRTNEPPAAAPAAVAAPPPLVIEWRPPSSAIEGSFEARRSKAAAARAAAPKAPEVADEKR